MSVSSAQLRSLIDLGLDLVSEGDPERMLQTACEAARDLFDATFVSLGTLSRDDLAVERLACGTESTGGASPAGWLELGDPVPGFLATVVSERRPIRGENPGGDPLALNLPPGHPQVQTFLAAPVASPAHVYGWICLVRNAGRSFTAHDEQLLMLLAAQIGGRCQLEREVLERQQTDTVRRYLRDWTQAQELADLQMATERMRFALLNADVGVWDLDYTTGKLVWSETTEAQYGLQPGTFGGTIEAFVEGIHPEDRQASLDTIEKAIRSGSDFSVQHRVLWPNGTVRWISGSGRIHLGEDGKPLRGVGISLDVTERHNLEEQFHQAQRMDAVGRLAGGVAHDFNNLLTVILGLCEMLLADLQPGDPRQADIGEIEKVGKRAADLTRQLLAFSRRQIIQPKLLDLNAIVEGMRAMLARLIEEHVTIVLRLRPGLASVRADRGQIEQLVVNLAVNARDAMPNGGTLTIATANVELDENYAMSHFATRPGSYVQLTVSDTGTGMTPQVQARLFEPFFTTKEVGKGTGLGLATVHGIVIGSGGSINVYSESGKGTSLKVYFPRSGEPGTAVETEPAASVPGRGTATVLVVEDAEGLRELTKRLLQRLGYEVLVAASAAEAIALFEENPSIDLLLTDVVMPGASGPQLAQHLIERRPELRVVYMSGYTEDAIVQHGVLKPGIALVHKPFTSESLGRAIHDVLGR